MQFSTRILLSALLLAVAGCSSAPPAVYTEEKFDSTNIYSRRFEVSSTVACEAVRRTLLSQGYVIVTSSPNQVTSSKSFQPRDDAHVQISFRVVCTDDDAKGDKSSIYVNALEDRYALKKVNNVASLGVGVLGSVSLPFSSSDDSLVKVASETISSDKFYSRFFYLVERFLDNATIEDEDEDHLAPPAATPKPAPVKPVSTERPVTTMPSSATSETPVAAAPAVTTPAMSVTSGAATTAAVASGVAATPAPIIVPPVATAAAVASTAPAPVTTPTAIPATVPAATTPAPTPDAPIAAPVATATTTETVANAAAVAAASSQTAAAATETVASHAAETPAPTAVSTSAPASPSIASPANVVPTTVPPTAAPQP